ncbi:MAG: hypothetical protein ACOYNL_01210 [Rickettsiales bacterium]
MDKPSFTVVQGTGSSVASNEAVIARELKGIEKFIAEQAKHYGFTSQNVESLHHAIQSSDVLRGLEDAPLKNVIVQAFENVKKSSRHAGITDLASAKEVGLADMLEAKKTYALFHGKILPRRPEVMSQLHQQVVSNDAKAMEQAAPTVKKSWLEGVSKEHKINAGIWSAGAAMSMLGLYSAAKRSVGKDEQGVTHIQWTQMGVAIIQACLAAGCGYMAAQTLRAGAQR